MNLPVGLRALRVEAGPETWLERPRRLRPDLPLNSGGAVLATWADDPWARAAREVLGQ